MDMYEIEYMYPGENLLSSPYDSRANPLFWLYVFLYENYQ